MKQTSAMDTCGCCEGVEILTPRVVENRPGLSALSYRVGVHADFLESMLARLSTLYLDIPLEELDEYGEPKLARLYPLANLKTRAADDPAIALLDAWATLADVLTFYQERIANEGFLRTATERRSILELARLVGYRLRPGVSASVYPAFTLEESYQIEIPAGTRSQSVPDPGETMQTFETAEPLAARAAWNAMKPRPTVPQNILQGVTPEALYFEGVNTNLKPGDPLLLVFYEAVGYQELHFIQEVEVQAEAERTKVTLQAATASAAPPAPATGPGPGPSLTEQAFAILERYSAVEDFQVNPATETAGRILEVLAELRAGLQTNPSPANARKLLKAKLPGLRAEHELAVENNFTRLEPWLGGMVADLEELLAGGSAPFPAVGLTGETASVFEGGENGDQGLPLQGLFTLAQPLSKPPSIPPPSSKQLARDVSTLFAAQADMVPRLLATLQPALAPALYSAWSGIKIPHFLAPVQAYALRLTAPLFGYNAPKQISIPSGGGVPSVHGDWPLVRLSGHAHVPVEEAGAVYLDNAYPKIVPESWLVVKKSLVTLGDADDTVVTSAGYLYAKARNPDASLSRAEYGISGKTTRVGLGMPGSPGSTLNWVTLPATSTSAPYPDFQAIRKTAVLAQSEQLTLAEEPIEDDVTGGSIELDGLYDGLETGRWLIVSGERSDVLGPDGEPLPGIDASELVMVAGVTQGVRQITVPWTSDVPLPDLPGDTPHTTLSLAKPLAYTYKRASVTIYGNVVKATHGETRQEVLGSGNGAQARQQFTLRQPPLTYVSAPTPSGIQSTLEVRVNQVRWPEADNLFVLGPGERGYLTRTNDEGKTSVLFGDGVHGARLPTGNENVRATYRSGIGKPGNVRAEQISLLATKPLGVKSVINPLPASGGADPESRDQARSNAPLAVLALDRLVSVRDYADFARTFAGVGKASARRLTDGRRQVVHVTIAGADDIPIDTTSDLYRNLLQTLQRYGEPGLALQLAVRELVLVVLSARVRVHPDYKWEDVEPQVRAALLEAFGFQNRELGQDLARSEIISVIQAARGVAYVDVDVLSGVAESTPLEDLVSLTNPTSPAFLGLAEHLPAALARLESVTGGGRQILPAQLAIFSPQVPDTLILSELTAS